MFASTNKIREKLRGRRGESLAEVMVSLAVAALSLTLLAALITTASNLIQSTGDSIEEYYQENNALSAQAYPAEPGTPPTVHIHYTGSDAGVRLTPETDADIKVYVYENEKSGANTILSYRKAG